MDSTRWQSKRLCAVLCVVGVVGCRPQGSHTEYSVVDGKNYCQVFTLPAPWSAKSPAKQWLGVSMKYRWPNNNHREILVTPEPEEETDYTTEKVLTGRTLVTPKYRITLSVPVRVLAATEEEWNLSTPARRWPDAAEMTYGLLGGGTGPNLREGERDRRELRLGGHLLERTGNIWAPDKPILLSASKKYVALQSWDGWSAVGKSPYAGKLHIDVYEVSTGRAFARIHGKWSDYTPEGAQAEVYWLSDNDLIAPFDWDERSFLLCHLP